MVASYSNRTLYSTSVHNDWQRTAAKAYKMANAHRACFNGLANDYKDYRNTTNDGWYYIYYTGDTNTIHYNMSGGPFTFTINGVDYTPTSGDGTFTVSGLTPNTVYEVAVDTAGDTNAKLLWFGFQSSIGNTSAPTFTTLTVPTVADFTNMYTSLSEAETAMDILPLPAAFSWRDLYYNQWRDIWHGGFIAGQDTLTFNVTVSRASGTGSVDVEALVGGSSAWSANYTTPQTVQIDVDLSALSLTTGAVTEIQIRAQEPVNTGEWQAQVNWMYTHTDPASPLTPAAELARGDAVSATGLNFMTAALDKAHPLNGTTRLMRELPAMRVEIVGAESWTPTDYYRIKHHRQFLRYRAQGSEGSPQLLYNGDPIDLSETAAAQIYDLSNLPDLAAGEYYTVTNCKYAFEDDTDA